MSQLLIFLVCFVFLFPSSGFAEWVLHQPQTTDKKVVLTDKEFEFNLGDINCGVTATRFVRNADDSIIEARMLYCWTEKETRVSIWGTCQKPLFEMTSFHIKRKDKTYSPALVCGSKR